jgi:hypothetical protein
MIRSIFRLASWSLFLGGWGLAALSLHVIRTPDRIGLIPKDRLGFADTYVDARAWKLDDLSNHPELVKRVLEANKAELFQYLAPGNDIASQLTAAIGNNSAPQQTGLFSSPARNRGFLGTPAGLFTQQSESSLASSFPVDF